jgi:regulator of protease activity HflC (stomatin/prohibitin superfamily)
MRHRALTRERQETITRDSVTVKLNAVLWYQIRDARKSVIAVRMRCGGLSACAHQPAQHHRAARPGRGIAGARQDQRPAAREHRRCQHPLGVEVERFQRKDVELPEAMQQMMAMQAEAIREKRARIIKAEAELEASRKLGDAAEQQTANNPVAVELRRMQMVTEVGAENNSTTVLMIPSDFVTLARSFSQYLSERAARRS